MVWVMNADGDDDDGDDDDADDDNELATLAIIF